MKINSKLHLAFQVESEKYGVVHVHCLPIAQVTFEQFYAELGAVFSKCFGDSDAQHLALVGPQIAYPALMDAAKGLGTWDTPSGVRLGLVNEFIRLTTVVYADPAGGGWKETMLASALSHGIVDDDAYAEVLNSITFFTSSVRAAPKALSERLLPMAGESRGWDFGFWNNTEFIASLPTLTPAEPTMKPTVSVTV